MTALEKAQFNVDVREYNRMLGNRGVVCIFSYFPFFREWRSFLGYLNSPLLTTTSIEALHLRIFEKRLNM